MAAAIAVELGAGPDVVLRQLGRALEGAVGLFRSANAPPGEPIEAWLDGQPMVASGGCPLRHVSAYKFESGIGIGYALRRPEMVGAIAGAFDAVTASGGEDPYRLRFASSLNELGMRTPWWRETLDSTIEVADQCSPATVEYRNLLVLPQVRILQAWADRDGTRFDECVGDAMEHHYRYWSRPDEAKAPEGRLAWLILGLCSRAHDDGMPIGVVCDYIPNWLLRKQW